MLFRRLHTSQPVVVLGLALMISAVTLLQGCVGLALGGAATGVAMVYDRRTAGAVLEDQAIELKAADAIRRDTDLRSPTHINITSYNGIVLVTGEAPTEALRLRVIALVGGIEKVRRVHNEVVMAHPSTLTSRSKDTALTASIKAKLFTYKDFDATRIKVVTENRVVYLMGIVTAREGTIAGEVARRIRGVQKVVKVFETIGRSDDT